MTRSDLDVHFRKIDDLVFEINRHVPPGSGAYDAIQFRSDLAGLLVVSMAATYETCVKQVLCEHASGHHANFGQFAQRNFEKLNSRIAVRDLEKYCKLFDPGIHRAFRSKLQSRRKKIFDRTGKNVEGCYEQILTWRHDFAHSRARNTTIEEAAATHKVGKRMLYIFDEVFAVIPGV